MPMIRKQILISDDQNRRLRAAAAAEGTTEAELVRKGIDLALDQANSDPEGWRERLLAVLENMEPMTDFADRVEANRKAQAALWKKRLARNRKLLDKR